MSIVFTDRAANRILRMVAVRLWLTEFVTQVTQAACCAAVGWILIAALRNAISFARIPAALVLLTVLVVWLAYRSARTFLRFKDALVIGMYVDRLAGLDNRITTALEIRDQLTELDAVQQLQLDDAVESLRTVKPGELIAPPKWSSPLAALLLCSVSGVLLFASPFFSPTVSAEERPLGSLLSNDQSVEIEKAISEVVKRLRLQAKENPSREIDSALAKSKQLLEKIQQGQFNTLTALQELSQLQQQVQKIGDEANTDLERSTWDKVADAFQSSQITAQAGDHLKAGQFGEAAKKMAEQNFESLADETLSAAEKTSLLEKLGKALQDARAQGDERLADALDGLAEAIEGSDSIAAEQQMQDLAAATAQYQMQLDQKQHLDDLNDQLSVAKQQLAISSNSSGDGQMGGHGLNEEQGQSEGKRGADSQKAGSKTAGNIDGPAARLEAEKKLAELQGQFGIDGEAETTMKSTEERPEFDITRKAQSVHAEYTRQLEADLRRHEIPRGHQEIVRRYFEFIRPSKR